MASAFDQIAEEYDKWYDASEGCAIFKEEVMCLRLLWNDYSGRWLEVGVGTGRFASALGVTDGIDLSPRMLEKAARRGVRTLLGNAERLPYRDHSFDGVLMVLTLCFLDDPAQALKECARVLCPNGRLLLGVVPADSQWEKFYLKKGAAGHPVYSRARFYRLSEIRTFAKNAGFEIQQEGSALLWKPGSESGIYPKAEPGIFREAGFIGLLLRLIG